MCREDAPRWRKWKHYPGAITFLIPRFVVCLGLGLIMTLFIKIWMTCHDRNKPVTGLRKYLCRNTFRFFMFLMGIFGWWKFLGHKYLSKE